MRETINIRYGLEYSCRAEGRGRGRKGEEG